MKQIPNLFTLLNLFLGCIAIVCVLQSGITLVDDVNGGFASVIPEKIYLASIFIAAAGIVDFLDGFVARLMKASSEMGKQLDSLADVVSFGVAPGMIIFQFLRLSFAQQPGGLDVSAAWLLPAFIIPCAGAYRLARFNIDTEQSYGFKGMPIPAAGLLIASFPLIYWFSDQEWIIRLLVNKWFLYGVIAVVSYLMVSTLPMMALKFKNASLKDNWPKLVLVIAAIICALLFHWLAVPLVFIVYIALSLALK
ncbi:CDP-alcohol phosphatidyltransferase family protein [Danxiaibacter flavus]|uniref:CDP-alcohol phosphatidyltransferase family protein n=1 Tax=Danxiaibacter flavus TaxID=3049108 RepID=A0ABV3Z940_9BACT|nr:CDP-alcohol phosphatidyltransferase family protein [Chitinophagaceae bacterium DXS]